MEYLDKIFNDELLQIISNSTSILNNLYCLISEYFRVLAQNNEQEKLDKTWKNIITTTLSQEKDQYLSILSNLLQHVSFSLYLIYIQKIKMKNK